MVRFFAAVLTNREWAAVGGGPYGVVLVFNVSRFPTHIPIIKKRRVHVDPPIRYPNIVEK